jgi:hypothetical protein
MSELEKYAFIHCKECGRDNRLRIDTDKAGHYQCGSCKAHLMFYGTQKQANYKNWIWGALIGLPIIFIGYKAVVDDSSWTQKNIQKFEKACEAKMFQTTNLSVSETEKYCDCIINKIVQYDYEKVIKSTQYYMRESQGVCRSGIQLFGNYR